MIKEEALHRADNLLDRSNWQGLWGTILATNGNDASYETAREMLADEFIAIEKDAPAK